MDIGDPTVLIVDDQNQWRDFLSQVLEQEFAVTTVGSYQAALERVGEHAKAVARANYLTVEHHLRKPLAGIRRLAVGIQAMLDRVLAAFVQRDLSLAQSVLGDAREFEARYAQVYQELLGVMNNHPRVVNQAIYLSRAAYNLRRAADRVNKVSYNFIGHEIFSYLTLIDERLFHVETPVRRGVPSYRKIQAYRIVVLVSSVANIINGGAGLYRNTSLCTEIPAQTDNDRR